MGFWSPPGLALCSLVARQPRKRAQFDHAFVKHLRRRNGAVGKVQKALPLCRFGGRKLGDKFFVKHAAHFGDATLAQRVHNATKRVYKWQCWSTSTHTTHTH